MTTRVTCDLLLNIAVGPASIVLKHDFLHDKTCSSGGTIQSSFQQCRLIMVVAILDRHIGAPSRSTFIFFVFLLYCRLQTVMAFLFASVLMIYDW